MKYHLIKINSISHYPIKKPSYWLLLFSITPLLLASSAMLSVAAPTEISQLTTVSNIKRPTLQIGSQGERVSELQAALKLLGFYTGTVDGVYQEGTARAVSQFKKAAGLNADGIVDAITWERLFPNISNFPPNTLPSVVPKPTAPKPSTTTPNKLNTSFKPTSANQRDPKIQYTTAGWPILRLGNSGSEVSKLQRLLQTLGFLKGTINGNFGITTETAVKAAQIRYGLQPDGVVGAATWEAFVRRLPKQP